MELNERYRKKNTFSFPSHRDDCLIFLPSYTCNPMHNRCSFRKDWALFKAEAVKAKPIFQLRIISPGLTQIKLNTLSQYKDIYECVFIYSFSHQLGTAIFPTLQQCSTFLVPLHCSNKKSVQCNNVISWPYWELGAS